jgi:hypothetical protein
VNELLNAIRSCKYRVTAADLAARSGVPLPDVERLLPDLVKHYRRRLRVGEAGDLVYEFDPALRPRSGGSGLHDALDAVLHAVVRALRVGFKALLAGLLFLYTTLLMVPVALVAGVVLTVVSFVAMLFSDGGGDAAAALLELATSEGGLIVLAVITLCAVLYFAWRSLRHITGFLLSLGRTAGPLERGRGWAGRFEHLMDRLYLFAVGPPLPPRVERREEDAIVVERARGRGGFLLSSDLVRARGLGLREADEDATRLLVELAGEPTAVEPGVVVYTFPKLAITAAADGGGDERQTSFEKMEPSYDVTGNSRRTDTVILGAVSMLLLVGLAVLLFVDFFWVRLVLGWIPFVFGAFTLALPALRWPLLTLLNLTVHSRNARRIAVRLLFDHLEGRSGESDEPPPDGTIGRSLSLPRFHARVLSGLRAWTKSQGWTAALPASEDRTAALEVGEDELRRVFPRRTQQAVDQLVADLSGEPAIEEGPDVLLFPELTRQLEASRTLEKEPPAPLRGVGRVVFDTGEAG